MGIKAGADREIQDASMYVSVAASQTTAQISRAGSAIGDYLDQLVITAASTAAPGTVTLFDGGTQLGVYGFVPAGMSSLTQNIWLGINALTTKGFNVTTGTSVSVLAIGRFDH